MLLFIIFCGFVLCDSSQESETILPFRVNVEEHVLQDLSERLQKTRIDTSQPIQLPDEWTRGTSMNFAQTLLDYWKTKYDWRSQEQLLNSMPQFITRIDDVDVHFIHIQSPHPTAQPLILVHGWPGSIVEFYKIIPHLLSPTDPNSPSFHIVCPSLPGFGFSKLHGKPKDQLETARLFDELMVRLGYEEYWAQGGDWGSLVTTLMAKRYKERVKGLHLNMIGASLPIGKGVSGKLWSLMVYLFPSFFLDKVDIESFQKMLDFSRLWNLSGYFHLQSTKPQTLGYSLHDSPFGLATYIVEKFSEWGDCNNKDILNTFTLDELLTNIMIYWINGPTTTINYYYECFHSDSMTSIWDGYVEVPVGVAVFPRDLIVPIRAFAEWGFNIVSWNVMEVGGHFAALEQPLALAKDIQDFRILVEKSNKNKQKQEV